MHLSKSTYYFEISKTDVVAERNAELLDVIRTVFEQNKRRYGVRRVHQELINIIIKEFRQKQNGCRLCNTG